MAIIKLSNGNITEIKNAENGHVLLNIQSSINGDKSITLALSGAIKTPSATAFSETLMEYLKETRKLIIDMTEVIYIASAGLRALLTAQQYIDESDDEIDMILKNINDEVMDVFETTGFDNVLTIEK